MSKYDTIEEVSVAKYNPYHDDKGKVAKSFDEIVEVEKFNPFHDAEGKFSNKNGFKSYSANPNTKAGAMAIARSAAAGHGSTLNVHRDSQGETIRRNANWIGRASLQSVNMQGSTALRRVIEPTAGLSGASTVGAAWQVQNQMQGRTTTGGKKPAQTAQQTTQQPAQQAQAAKPTQTQPQPQKPAQQAQQTTGRAMVTGKDISKTFKVDPTSKDDPLSQVSKAQGYDQKPQLEANQTKFSAAVAASGFIAYRTIANGTDVVTGKRKTGAQFTDDLKNADDFSHNGTGYKVYGGGIYMASTPNPVKGTTPSRKDTNAAKTDSQGYGRGGGDKTVAMTLSPNAKVGDYYQIQSKFNSLPRKQRARFGNDMAAYAASLGYDALRAVNAGWNCDYLTVYNRSALIIYDN